MLIICSQYRDAVLRTNAPQKFPMPSSNLTGFGTWRHLTFRFNLCQWIRPSVITCTYGL